MEYKQGIYRPYFERLNFYLKFWVSFESIQNFLCCQKLYIILLSLSGSVLLRKTWAHMCCQNHLNVEDNKLQLLFLKSFILHSFPLLQDLSTYFKATIMTFERQLKLIFCCVYLLYRHNYMACSNQQKFSLNMSLKNSVIFHLKVLIYTSQQATIANLITVFIIKEHIYFSCAMAILSYSSCE